MDTPHPTTRPDHRDLSLEHFAADEAALLDYCAELRADVDVYRALAQVALKQVAELTRVNARLRDVVSRQSRIIREHVEGRPARRGERAA